ncbi:MAG: DUF541 domain-containing protein [Proteobacteria bacterium]|nr:MAG: DUF541 domain-containing protein [Pseudomonadota bacterium]
MKNMAYFFALLLSFNSIAGAAPTDLRVISVRGEGELKVAPDVAIVSLSVETKAKDAKAAQKANAEEMARVNKVLRNDFSIDAKDIQTDGFSMGQDYRFEKDGRRVFVGFAGHHSLTVRMKKLDRVGELMDKLPSAGAGEARAVELRGVSFDSDKRRDHETEVLGIAMANAKDRATALAGFAKKGLKGVLRISDSAVQYQPYAAPYAARSKNMAMADAESAPTEISAGQITINANVAIDYEMD